MEKSINKFEFKIAAGQDLPAIWFIPKKKEVCVFPLELFAILWECDKEHRISHDIKARFLFFPEKVFGNYFDDSCGAYQIEYTRNAFINSAIKALKDLCHYVIKDGVCYYCNFTVETAEALLLGIDDLSIPRNYSQIFFKEIRIDNFSFRFIESYSCDTAYEIKIGNRSYISYLSDWTTDFNQLLNEIESFVLSASLKKEIHLHFEDSPTILRLETRNLFPVNIVYSEMVRLTIIPNEFSKSPIVFGWCQARQIIRAIYLGLLELFTTDTDCFDDGFYGTWDDFRLRAYNQLQSCIVENYINEQDKSEQDYSPRNRTIHSVEKMIKDFKSLQNSLKQQ